MTEACSLAGAMYQRMRDEKQNLSKYTEELRVIENGLTDISTKYVHKETEHLQDAAKILCDAAAAGGLVLTQPDFGMFKVRSKKDHSLMPQLQNMTPCKFSPTRSPIVNNRRKACTYPV